jgi:hypothetical protein
MDLYNNFFYLAQFTLDESTSALTSPCMYGFHLNLIADTGTELERFNVSSLELLRHDTVALHMKFKVLFDKEISTEESSIKLASLLYKEDFNTFIDSFENYPQYSRHTICKGRINTPSNLYDVIEAIRIDIKTHISNPLDLDKYADNQYHNPHQGYKKRMAKHLLFLEDSLSTEIKRLTDLNLDKSYFQAFDEKTPGDLAFRKYPFCLANPKGALNNIKLRDKLDLSLDSHKTTKVHKI